MKKIALGLVVLILGLSIYSSTRTPPGTCQEIAMGACVRKTFIGLDFLLYRVGYVSHIYNQGGTAVEQTESGFGYGPSIIFDEENRNLSFEGKNAPFHW